MTILAELALALALSISACAGNGADNGLTGASRAASSDGNETVSGNPLVGTWHCKVSRNPGHINYYWAFGEDGGFAHYVAGYTPPQNSSTIPSSVSERFARGRYRVNGGIIECHDIEADSHLSVIGEWRHFPDRKPADIADKLFAVRLNNPKKADDFTVHFDFIGAGILRLAVDGGDFPGQYDMNFDFIDTAAK